MGHPAAPPLMTVELFSHWHIGSQALVYADNMNRCTHEEYHTSIEAQDEFPYNSGWTCQLLLQPVGEECSQW